MLHLCSVLTTNARDRYNESVVISNNSFNAPKLRVIHSNQTYIYFFSNSPGRNNTHNPNQEISDCASIKILKTSSDWVKLNISLTPHPSVTLVQLCVRQADQDNSTLEADLGWQEQGLYLIDRLHPSQEYEVWLQLVLANNQSLSTSQIHFNTTDGHHPPPVCDNRTHQLTVRGDSCSKS